MFVIYFSASIILRQVVEGLLYLHSHGILHRDLSLANLLLTKDMKVVSEIKLLVLALTVSKLQFKHATLLPIPRK